MKYRITPVNGYIELEKKIEEIKESQDLKYIIFINCGSRLNLTSKWFYLDSKRKIRAILMDKHRPIHHSNMTAGRRIIIIGILFYSIIIKNFFYYFKYFD